MSDEFDPYYAWLGIPPKDQPPNHYRLLGLDLFETNLDVIESAAFRQMGHVRTYQSGQHSRESQQLLNELSAAKISLLRRYIDTQHLRLRQHPCIQAGADLRGTLALQLLRGFARRQRIREIGLGIRRAIIGGNQRDRRFFIQFAQLAQQTIAGHAAADDDDSFHIVLLKKTL